MFHAFYDKQRFKFIHNDIVNTGLLSKYSNVTLIKKTACFYGEKINVYIDTSDGVNEDIGIQEYCGRMKRVIIDSKGKPFLYFKSAYSNKWSKNITSLAKKNNGEVLPFYKWSFNDNFYSQVFNKRDSILEKYKNLDKVYDVGIFFGNKVYDYPKPSAVDPLISWTDHQDFNLPASSPNMGTYSNNSRNNLISKIKSSNLNVLHTSLNYEDYIRESFKCKVIINPPGVGEYTSRMVDQTYLGNCIVLRENSYDNCISWKNYLPEIDFNSEHWKAELINIINNYKDYQIKSRLYYDKFWTSEKIVQNLFKNIQDKIVKLK